MQLSKQIRQNANSFQNSKTENAITCSWSHQPNEKRYEFIVDYGLLQSRCYLLLMDFPTLVFSSGLPVLLCSTIIVGTLLRRQFCQPDASL